MILLQITKQSSSDSPFFIHAARSHSFLCVYLQLRHLQWISHRFSRQGRMPSFVSLLSGTAFHRTASRDHAPAVTSAADLPFLPSDAAELEALVLEMNVVTCAAQHAPARHVHK
jgi:hypothetical protein